MEGALYFHSPCFDGIASAVLMTEFLRFRGWTTFHHRIVNYHLRTTWLSTPLPAPSAVVDFLYHPDVTYWADHHGTTFLTAEARADYAARQANPELVYDASAASCAGLLWRHLHSAFSFRTPCHEELVRWAEKTDAARYESVDEVFASTAPALRINASLALASDKEAYCVRLVNALGQLTLAEVAELPDVRTLCAEAGARQERGQVLFREAVHCSAAKLTADEIVVFDVHDPVDCINRYAPYYFFRTARYSAGITRNARGASITAMRNPWREFPCAPLGKLCEPLGGGGHQRVGAISLPVERSDEAAELLNRLLDGIRAFHSQSP